MAKVKRSKPKSKFPKTKAAQPGLQTGATQASGVENEIVKIIEARISQDRERAQRYINKLNYSENKKSQPGAVAEVKNSNREQLLPPQREGNLGKKTLVLDLDETLIHSVFKPVENSDMIVKIPEEVTDHSGNRYSLMNDIYVYKRPGVDMFLKRLARYYELVIFTASIDKYANPVINSLDTEKCCEHRLYREH